MNQVNGGKQMSLFRRMIIVSLFFAVAYLSGCANESPNAIDSGDAKTAAEKVDSKPITLKVLQNFAAISDDEFANYIAQPVHKKYPNITMEMVRSKKGAELPDLIAAGTPPDMVYFPHERLQYFLDLNMAYDLDGLIKNNKFDLSQFQTEAIEGIRGRTDSGKLYALPFSLNWSALMYNKDIFDKFGVPYPKDQMTWDEVFDLGKKVARTEGDVQYKALYVGSLTQFSHQLTVAYTDPKTDAPLLDSSKWAKAATYYKQLYEIPGNTKPTLGDFWEKKNMAMYAGVGIYTVGQVEAMRTKGTPFSWDLVSYPNFPESKGKAMSLDAHSLLITTTSKYKEQAFDVLTLVTAKDNQLYASRKGRVSPLKDQELKVQFGQDVPSLQGKNLQGIFLNTVSLPDMGKYIEILQPLVNKESSNLTSGKSDVNTFLRDLQEAAKKAIAEDKAAKGK
jgi:multiple sugar transport system substrate-binding protein